MARRQDLDLKRRYRRAGVRVGDRGELRPRRSRRGGLIPMILFAVAFLVIGLVSSIPGARERAQDSVGRAAPAHP